MVDEIKITNIPNANGLSEVGAFGLNEAKKAHGFHQTIPEYEETKLVQLKNLANYYGVKEIFIKDESSRFGLNAFKGLGGSYCIAKYIADKIGVDISELTYDKIISPEVKAKIGTITFVTATDGNHGRGIAWTAKCLNQKAVVYMPKGSSKERLKNIQDLGAEASITDLSYDDAVRFAHNQAEKNGWVFTQDTAWDGYTVLPSWIMQGYLTMAYEATEQLKGLIPTHIFLQAGVGAMSAALTGFFRDYYKEEKPIITIIEPDKADCLFRTAAANDGSLHNVTERMDSIMVGLCCGEPCTIGWNILKEHANYFISMPDWVAAKGMRMLGNPLQGDTAIISGESGAATSGFVFEVLENDRFKNIKEKIGLNKDSVILCISTEGDTDKENYRKIVWDGLYSSF